MHHFRVILPKLVLTPQKETSSCVFKMTIFSKFFGFHDFLSTVESGFLRIRLYQVWYQGIVKATVSGVLEDFFQTFWKLHCCAKFLFIELETSNFGYLLIF
jgi:hypothetical protein